MQTTPGIEGADFLFVCLFNLQVRGMSVPCRNSSVEVKRTTYRSSTTGAPRIGLR